jgi:glycosyltransferase involved in cell wall biosynthesis
MPRILVLNYEFPPLGGGASPVSYELAEKLSETGDFDIDVVTMGFKGLPKYEEVNKNFRIHRVHCLRSKKEICQPWEQLTYLVTGFVKTRSLIKQAKKDQKPFEICHTHFIIPTGALSYILKKFYGLPYIITSHGSDVPGFNTDRFKFLHKFTKPFLKGIIKNSKKVISPSNYLRDLILKNISPAFSVKVVVIPNGIDTNKFKPQEKKKWIFSSGRLLPRKGFQYLIQAVSDEDIGWEVHIAGDGPMMSELKRLAEKSKTKVILHGWLNNNGKEYKDLMEQSAIFVLVSRSESFGMVVAEAMSAGCAIIATSGNGVSETVINNGLLVGFGDVLGIKKTICDFIFDEVLMNNMAKKAVSHSKNVFNWCCVLQKYIRFLIV